MAHIYALSDGSDTVLLNSYTNTNPFQVSRWLLQTPTPSQMPQGVEGTDAGLAPWEYGSVTETIEFGIFSNLGGDSVQAQTRRIQILLDKARQRQKTGMGPKVYIQAQITGDDTDLWRSEILAGRLALKDAPHQLFYSKWLDASLSYTRRYFWEQDIAANPDGTEPLNLKSSEDTTGAEVVDVYNNDDATPTATNYVLALAPVSPAGDYGVLPAPMRLEITNDSGSTLSWRDFYLCNWVSDDATVIDPFLLGSEASPSASYALTTSESTGWRWDTADLTSTRVAQLAGKPYHILVAFSTGQDSTGVYLRAVVEANVGGSPTPLLQTGLVNYSGEGLIDLGVLPLPPGGYDEHGGGISLSIAAFRPAGTVTMVLDFVQLTPAGDGLFQRVRQIDFSAAVGDILVIDGIEDRAYLDDGTGMHIPVVRKRSLPLMLYTDKWNTVRILFNLASGFTAGLRTELSAYWRKRRLDI